MKKVNNVDMYNFDGSEFQEFGKTVKMIDVCLTALNHVHGSKADIWSLGLKLYAMKKVDAPAVLLEDAEFDAVKQAVETGPFRDFIMNQAKKALDSAESVKVEIK